MNLRERQTLTQIAEVRNGRGEAEADDLCEGVDAGVGAPGTLWKNFLAGEALEAAGERALNGGEAGLG